jgi:hypothetical protein
MTTANSSGTASSTRYLAFDKYTGRVLGSHTRFSVLAKDYVQVPIDDLKKMWSKDKSLLQDLTNHDFANLEILEVGPQSSQALKGPAMVDVARKILVAQPKLSLTSDKPELEGNGEDRATITITVLNADGAPIRDFKDKIKVTTTRGKLSARGGIVDLVDGGATVVLTSSAETVSSVRVQATAVDAVCAAAYVELEFV